MSEAAPELTIRLLEAADRAELRKLPTRVSPESAISRFHGALTSLSEPLLDRLLDLEVGQREAVVAIDAEGIAGVARFVRDDPTSAGAEIAVLVADVWQHHGVAHQMLDLLMARARAAGISRLRGDMLATNVAARHLLSSVGRIIDAATAEGHVVLTIEIGQAPTDSVGL